MPIIEITKEVFEGIGKAVNKNKLEEKEKEIERLHSIIKEVRELINLKIDGYKMMLRSDKYTGIPQKEVIELEFRIREQEELLEILDKENI